MTTSDGDIDDRVRAIAAQMDLQPIIWTSTGTGQTFDTEGPSSSFRSRQRKRLISRGRLEDCRRHGHAGDRVEQL